MSLVLWLAVLAAAIFTCLTYFVYLHEVLNLPRDRFDPAEHGGIGRLALRGIVSSLASQLIIYFTYVLGFFRVFSEPAPNADSGRPPVILVHGLYHNPAAWIMVRRWLAGRGYARVHCFGYSSFGPPFEAIAEALARKIADVSARNGGEKVLLFGHSLGGLLIRAALSSPDTAAVVIAVATMGTPYRGSKLAALAPGKLGKRIKPESALFTAPPPFPDARDIPWLCLTSPADNMVLPPQCLIPESLGPRLCQGPAVCHTGMLYHKPTVNLALDFFDAASAQERNG